MTSFFALGIGFALDLLFGDPLGWPHIVVGFGKLITQIEKGLRKILRKTPRAEFWGGVILVILMTGIAFGITMGLLVFCQRINPYVRLAVESILCWQCLSMRSLQTASGKVYSALKNDDLQEARAAVGQIVGRDTASLNSQGVVRATIETVAENTSDGVIAPMLFIAFGGGVAGVLYKAINTMDSMVGYKNAQYLFFGRAAARLDDLANFIPARIAGLLIVLSAYLSKQNGKNAWRIFRRDRHKHKSPNSAQTEAACAGALNIQLGGNAYYFGELVEKPVIGDDNRPITAEDIPRANVLLVWASCICLFLCLAGRGAFLWL